MSVKATLSGAPFSSQTLKEDQGQIHLMGPDPGSGKQGGSQDPREGGDAPGAEDSPSLYSDPGEPLALHPGPGILYLSIQILGPPHSILAPRAPFLHPDPGSLYIPWFPPSQL